MRLRLNFCILLVIGLWSCSDNAGGGGALPTVGSEGVQSGSYANMLVVNDFLYAVSDSELITYELSDKANPQEIDRQELVFGVESIFHRNGILFIGSSQSMYIYQIVSGIPQQKSETAYVDFGELTPCDPIVANDTLAIASLSSTVDLGRCGSTFINELRFFDVTSIKNPILINQVEMNQPKGMALDDNILFVCEAQDGLKIFDIADAYSPELLYHFEGFEAYDVIATGSLLIVVGPEFLHEFDYEDIDDVKRLSALKL